jgi:hypothetical protein
MELLLGGEFSHNKEGARQNAWPATQNSAHILVHPLPQRRVSRLEPTASGYPDSISHADTLTSAFFDMKVTSAVFGKTETF